MRKAVFWNGVTFLQGIGIEKTTLIEVFIFQHISQFKDSKQ